VEDEMTEPREPRTGEIPRRKLGRTGVEVCALGLGGYHLGAMKSQREAVRIVQAAVDGGITFLDNAWEYHDGRSETIMGRALAGRRPQVFLMTKVCTHGRGRREALRQLEQSLARLRTDYLDLWQVHEVVYESDPERHAAPGGVLEALDQAKQQGKVRFVGFTGHKSPTIHQKMLRLGFPFDTCQLPLNCLDGTFRSFEREVLPDLVGRGIAPLGMKSMGGEGDLVKKKVVSAEEALRYAMSLPVATTITGIDSMKVLRQDLRLARGFQPMTASEMEGLRRRCAAAAADGRFELYKVSMRHEGSVGRKQHNFPTDEELGA
jgi:predicted aldo/keto reductase-like oxidoreductase